MFCSYNQVFKANPLSANKHVSTHFFDWKMRLWHVSAIPQKVKNDRLLDIFSQKTRQKSQLKRKKKLKKQRFHRRFSHKRASSPIPASHPQKRSLITPSGLVFWQGGVDAQRQRCHESRVQWQPHRVGLSKHPNSYTRKTLKDQP